MTQFDEHEHYICIIEKKFLEELWRQRHNLMYCYSGNLLCCGDKEKTKIEANNDEDEMIKMCGFTTINMNTR